MEIENFTIKEFLGITFLAFPMIAFLFSVIFEFVKWFRGKFNSYKKQ